MKQKIHHFIINNNTLYSTLKFSQVFPFKQTRKFFRNRYIKNNIIDLSPEVKKKPVGQVCIETTSICNTKCSFCPHSEMKREKMIMPDHIFKRAVREIKAMKLRNIGLYYFGEPLTDPQLADRINFIKKDYHCYIQVITNGLLLDDSWADKLLQTDLDELLISLDATDKESYEKIRKGSFDKVERNVLNFASLKKEKPKLIVRTMVTGDNKKQVKKFTKYWKGKVDEVQYGRIHNFNNKWAESHNKHILNSPCLFLWTQLIILSDGSVIPCCIDYEGNLRLGNIMNKSLNKIWNGDAVKYLRQQHNEGNYTSQCKNCDINDSLVARWWNYD